MTLDKVIPLLTKAFQVNCKVLLLGSPGLGKTDAIEHVASNIGADIVKYFASLADPTDIKGCPAIITVDGKQEAHFLPFGDLNKLIKAEKKTLCFFDDIGASPVSVQASLLNLILARQVNGTKISPHIVFCAATNNVGEHSGVNSIIEPLKSRFDTIIKVQADFSAWKLWAIANNIRAEVIGFLHFKQNLLSAFTPSKLIQNSPSPRQWVSVSKWLDAGFGADDLEIFSGSVGDGAGIEFITYLKHFAKLPDLDSIIKNPTSSELPTEMGVRYAICTGLARRVVHIFNECKGDKTIVNSAMSNALKYLHRYSGAGNTKANEFEVVMMKDAFTLNNKIAEFDTYIKWGTVNSDLLC